MNAAKMANPAETLNHKDTSLISASKKLKWKPMNPPSQMIVEDKSKKTDGRIELTEDVQAAIGRRLRMPEFRVLRYSFSS